MRRLVSKEEGERVAKRNKMLIGILLGSVMILSSIGFAIQSRLSSNAGAGTGSSDQVSYNGFNFVYQNGLWILGSLVFTYNPNQIDLTIPESSLSGISGYQGKTLYISSESPEARNEIYLNMINYVDRVQEACPEGKKCAVDIPVKTCADNFIIIAESNSSSINQQNGCVYIKGNGVDLVKVSDEFLFRVLGIRQ